MDRLAGLTDQSVSFAAFTTTTGAAVTVTSATAGLSLWYRRGGTGAKVAVSPSDLATLATAHADGGILVIEGQDHRLDLPDAAFASGVDYLEWGGTATGITIDGGSCNLIGQATTGIVGTSQAIRDAMKLAPSAGAAAAGSLDAKVDAIDPLDATETQAAAAAAITAAGTGARTVAITVNDGTTALESARVRVTKGAESYATNTNASGLATFNLDDGTWTVAITLAGYTYSGTSLVVNGDETATYSMTAIAFSPTPDAGQVTAWGYVYSPAGVVEPGATVVLEQRTAGARQIYDNAPRTLTADANGLVSAVVWADGSEYRYRRSTGGDWTELFAPEDDGDEDLPNSYRLPGWLGAS